MDDCDSVYAYRHRLNLTSDGTLLNTELSEAKLSASPDHPESLLDALLQVAVCEVCSDSESDRERERERERERIKGNITEFIIQEEVGWRVKGQSRRLIVAITDGDYHFALDGRVGPYAN